MYYYANAPYRHVHLLTPSYYYGLIRDMLGNYFGLEPDWAIKIPLNAVKNKRREFPLHAPDQLFYWIGFSQIRG